MSAPETAPKPDMNPALKELAERAGLRLSGSTFAGVSHLDGTSVELERFAGLVEEATISRCAEAGVWIASLGMGAAPEAFRVVDAVRALPRLYSPPGNTETPK